jgi:hypothetical protein
MSIPKPEITVAQLILANMAMAPLFMAYRHAAAVSTDASSKRRLLGSLKLAWSR